MIKSYKHFTDNAKIFLSQILVDITGIDGIDGINSYSIITDNKRTTLSEIKNIHDITTIINLFMNNTIRIFHICEMYNESNIIYCISIAYYSDDNIRTDIWFYKLNCNNNNLWFDDTDINICK